jgi:deoxyribodipyrimidine photolyase-related protein
MTEATEIIIIYPNSLFENNNLIHDINVTDIYILEDPIYFTEYKYHKMKLVLHRASMKYYKDFIDKKYKVNSKYIEYDKVPQFYKNLKNVTIHLHNPIEHLFDERVLKKDQKNGITFVVCETPLFLSKTCDLISYVNKKGNKKVNHSEFYKYQRKRYDILMTAKGEPEGGLWSFDRENRKPFPKGIKDIKIPSQTNTYITEAKKYVETNFKNNPGSPDLYLPIEFNKVKKYFENFLKNKLSLFGEYEDAVSKDINFGYHSVLSPLMNIGLITPDYVISEIKKIKITKTNISSIEGYTRQIIGWREYCRLLYVTKREELDGNLLNHKRNLGKSWYSYNINTGFQMIDNLVKSTLNLGYLHHIERLMYIGNYFLLNQVEPQQVFTWFQTMFIDSYHVFMYPNVYGMSQYACGPLMTTRPYFSSSSYIIRMSDYKKNDYSVYDKSWSETWDALYYNFINNNKALFKKNYAIANQVKNWENKSKGDKKELLNMAKKYYLDYDINT